MRRILRLILSHKGDEFAETAIAMPVILLVTIALMNLTMAGFASVNANNAANYGARIGSVYQQGMASAAYSAAEQSVSYAKVGGYTVGVSGGGFPGAEINVTVGWDVPNLMGGLLSFVGGSSLGGDLTGSAVSTFRQEGW
ncbi:MAG: TadE/TadG family type IV pilus assembly protein [Anaerolineales bacterium]